MTTLSSNAPLLTLNSIDKSYSLGAEKLQVLYDINLSIRKGEFISILGPSGSGKSTLMNIIGCMDTADCGQIVTVRGEGYRFLPKTEARVQ